MQRVAVKDLGAIAYDSAWQLQEELLQQNLTLKANAANAGTFHHLLFCEHPHVYTLGKNGKQSNLLISESELAAKQVSFFHINRGGDITYHGPGQIVGYPILDLEKFSTDIGLYLRNLEEVIIRTLNEWDIRAERSPGETGVWLDANIPGRERKICAIGIRCSRWVTMHGFALNVNTDLQYFDHIIPCGIATKKVSSIQQELGRPVPLEEVKNKISQHFAAVFGCDLVF